MSTTVSAVRREHEARAQPVDRSWNRFQRNLPPRSSRSRTTSPSSSRRRGVTARPVREGCLFQEQSAAAPRRGGQQQLTSRDPTGSPGSRSPRSSTLGGAPRHTATGSPPFRTARPTSTEHFEGRLPFGEIAWLARGRSRRSSGIASPRTSSTSPSRRPVVTRSSSPAFGISRVRPRPPARADLPGSQGGRARRHPGCSGAERSRNERRGAHRGPAGRCHPPRARGREAALGPGLHARPPRRDHRRGGAAAPERAEPGRHAGPRPRERQRDLGLRRRVCLPARPAARRPRLRCRREPGERAAGTNWRASSGSERCSRRSPRACSRTEPGLDDVLLPAKSAAPWVRQCSIWQRWSLLCRSSS